MTVCGFGILTNSCGAGCISSQSPRRSACSPLEDVAGPHTGTLANRAPLGARFFHALELGSAEARDGVGEFDDPRVGYRRQRFRHHGVVAVTAGGRAVSLRHAQGIEPAGSRPHSQGEIRGFTTPLSPRGGKTCAERTAPGIRCIQEGGGAVKPHVRHGDGRECKIATVDIVCVPPIVKGVTKIELSVSML